MVYLFIGEDCPAKDIQLKRLKEDFLTTGTEEFNFDRLYAEDLALKDLQEKLFYLPLKSSKRIVVIKQAQNFKEDLKEFIIKFSKKPSQQIILVLDIDKPLKAAEFINPLYKYAKVFRFQETRLPDAFNLNRQILLKRPDYALRILNQLLKNGERPERILGGLRYTWEKDAAAPLEMRKKLRFLLACDIDIKTGRLKPHLALEKLVINLCSFREPSR